MCNKYEVNPKILDHLWEKGDSYNWKWAKKGDFENTKIINFDFSTEQSPFSTIFAILWFSGSTKLVLSGDPHWFAYF